MIESILKGFDIWTDAQSVKSKGRVKSIDNISLEGLASLRQLIIELAVRGKLINQNPAEGKAIDLLKEIHKNKENLILEGKVRKEKNDDVTEVENIPFEIPNAWIWVKLQTLSTINGGYAFKSNSYSDEGHRVIRISDFDEKGFKDNNVVRYKYSDVLEPFLLFEKNILLAMTGGTVGKSYLVKELSEPMLVNQRVASINLIKPVNEEYIHYVIQSKHVKDVIENAKNSTNDNISMSDIKGFKIPLPPLAEQTRIIEKVNLLMSWCDQLEEQQTANLTTHHYLVKSLLETLTNAANADELQAAWEKLSEHFDTLFCTEDSIEQLKQTILQLAIMGRLVKQDPNDESGSQLLLRIINEKMRLAGKKQIDNTDASNISDEIQFIIPKSWAITRFENLTQLAYTGIDKGKALQNENYRYRYFKMNNILNNGGFDLTDITRIDATDIEVEKFALENGDFLFNTRNSRELVGKTCVIRGIENGPILYNNNILRVKFIYVIPEFVDFWFRSNKGKEFLEKIKSNTTNVCAIYQGKLFQMPCVIPPLKEQARIVSKVNELFTYCDTLSEKITIVADKQAMLAQSVINSDF